MTMKPGFLLAACLSATCLLAQEPIRTGEFVSIGGIRQYITIEGEDSTKPLLLFLHGGPGGSVLSYADKFTDRLKQHFVVVQWDQRETGRTLEVNASPTPFSVTVFEEDTQQLIRYLLTRFQRAKLYLAGHSWGTVPGFRIARQHPELLYAYIPIGAMVHQLESERIALEIMKKRARETGNTGQSAELDRVRVPFENGEQLFYHRKWLLEHAGSRRRLSKSYVENWSRTWLSLFNEASGENLIESLPSINCPVFFFAGRNDLQTNSAIAEEYYRKLNAPAKGFYWFERSAHAIPTSEPARMQDIIIREILPRTLHP